MLAELGDEWRPDRSGVLITPVNDGIPESFSLRQGIEFMIVDREPAMRGDRLISTVLHFIRRETATYLSIPGPPGHYATRVLLNAVLGGTAETSDLGHARRMLVQMLEGARTHSFERVTLKFAPSR
jgi:hypothetical protein